MHIPHKTPSEALLAYADLLDKQEGTEHTDRHAYLRKMAAKVEIMETAVSAMKKIGRIASGGIQRLQEAG